MKVRRTIRGLPPYVVPQDGVPVKLNQNESPFDLPETLKQEILHRLAGISWNRYPAGDAGRMVSALSRYTNHSPAGLLVGNGSNEMLEAIFSAIGEAGDRIVLISPGYSVVSRLARIRGLRVIDVPLLDTFEFDVPALIKQARAARLVVLATPNNPTGTVLDLTAIEAIVDACKGVVVIDEAYHEFHRESAQVLLDQHNNLIITRTFSKAFGLAGIRLGYLLARPGLAGELEKAKLPFSVGIFQQIAGEVVLDNVDILQRGIKDIIRERERIFATLQTIPEIVPIPSAANFILFQVKAFTAPGVFETLHEQGILVRHFNSDRIDNMLRVTIGKPEENDMFVRCLRNTIETM